MRLTTPRIVVAGLSGDSGKTLLALGLVRAFARRGLAVAPFKKGPDYIDAAWLGAAAGRPGRNLDTFLMDDAALGTALATASESDLIVVEGNRGLFDGVDAAGTHSTAELAKRIGAPLLLLVDVARMTRTAAALVAGCRAFDPALPLAGVILNRVATVRQEQLVRETVESACGVPVVGALPVLPEETRIPRRHLGLVTAAEEAAAETLIERAADAAAGHVDLGRVHELARGAPERLFADGPRPVKGAPSRIAVVRDEAFSFYYPENLEALEARGAELVFVSALADEAIPDVDAVYVGGGFPEVHAARLAAAGSFLASLRDAAKRRVPIYAECGGLMLLARSLAVGGATHEMAGILELDVVQERRPQGHGYAVARVDGANAFLPEGARISGHEFHYSRVAGGRDAAKTAMALERGHGVSGGRDGVTSGTVFASYIHVHAGGSPAWADGVAAAARRHAAGRTVPPSTSPENSTTARSDRPATLSEETTCR
ncbi:MAG TPA: cobyrinate a,c-diamide synthase [Thermoanaerobaculia bacterium]|nr:cobyrinate a,c-diamide synthase [Thermoanaerobaculia bacterium]